MPRPNLPGLQYRPHQGRGRAKEDTIAGSVGDGGSRGIGAAISRALKADGFTVAANYAGNDEAAQVQGRTGIPVFKWDVGDYDATRPASRSRGGEVGPVDMLVNNAGITRDGFFHRMTKEQWSAVIRTNLDSLFNMTRPVIKGMRARSLVGSS